MRPCWGHATERMLDLPLAKQRTGATNPSSVPVELLRFGQAQTIGPIEGPSVPNRLYTGDTKPPPVRGRNSPTLVNHLRPNREFKAVLWRDPRTILTSNYHRQKEARMRLAATNDACQRVENPIPDMDQSFIHLASPFMRITKPSLASTRTCRCPSSIRADFACPQCTK